MKKLKKKQTKGIETKQENKKIKNEQQSLEKTEEANERKKRN